MKRKMRSQNKVKRRKEGGKIFNPKRKKRYLILSIHSTIRMSVKDFIRKYSQKMNRIALGARKYDILELKVQSVRFY